MAWRLWHLARKPGRLRYQVPSHGVGIARQAGFFDERYARQVPKTAIRPPQALHRAWGTDQQCCLGARLLSSGTLSRNVWANSRKRYTSAKFVASPNETRTAPPVCSPIPLRKSSKGGRSSIAMLCAHTSRGTPIATSPAPGLQKQPVRKEIC